MMNKSDLKDGQCIGLRKYNRCGDAEYYKGYIIDFQTKQIISLGLDYNDDLTHKYDEDLDIMAIYDDKESKCLWNREEIDWTKVQFGAKVRCWDKKRKDLKYEGKFLNYNKDCDRPFEVYVDRETIIEWDNCELIQDIEKISSLDIQKEKQRHCGKFEIYCVGCKYKGNNCRDKWFDDNFIAIRK